MFSADAKDEIAAASFECSRCAGHFLHALAVFGARGPRRKIVIARAATARAALRAAKRMGVHLEHHSQLGRLDISRRTKADRSYRFDRYILHGLSGEFVATALRVPSRACCRRAALRGAFLAAGSVTDPRRGYHLEFACRTDDAVRALTGLLAALGADAAVTRRRRRPLVYVKGASGVADVLAIAGAARAVLALDDLLALRYTKNLTRRRVNSEAANAARSAATSARQREAALRVSRGRRQDALTPALREGVRLRIAHPHYTLAELGARARPPVSKAAMAYRLREIERLSRR